MLRLIRLTAPGRSAVTTLLLRGPQAATVLESFLDRSLPRQTESPIFARFRLEPGSAGDAVEEIVVHRVSPELVRFHTHGGAAVFDAVVSTLAGAGVETLDWKDFFRESVREGDLQSWIEAEARIALARCATQRTAKILLDQLGGALFAAFREERIAEALSWSQVGLHLTEPYRVALVGMTNAGKSSLFNALLGFTRGIVDATPGTTRDAVGARSVMDGWPVLLIDTAGRRGEEENPMDELERAGIARGRETLDVADLLVEVVDAASPRRIELPQTASRLVVYNKIDLPGTEQVRTLAETTGGLCLSAATGEGVDALVERIASTLVPQAPEPGAAVPFTPELVALFAERT